MQSSNLSNSLDLVQMTPLISIVWIVIQVARKAAVFLAEESKISRWPEIGPFSWTGPGYLLYLHDVLRFLEMTMKI